MTSLPKGDLVLTAICASYILWCRLSIMSLLSTIIRDFASVFAISRQPWTHYTLRGQHQCLLWQLVRSQSQQPLERGEEIPQPARIAQDPPDDAPPPPHNLAGQQHERVQETPELHLEELQSPLPS